MKEKHQDLLQIQRSKIAFLVIQQFPIRRCTPKHHLIGFPPPYPLLHHLLLAPSELHPASTLSAQAQLILYWPSAAETPQQWSSTQHPDTHPTAHIVQPNTHH